MTDLGGNWQPSFCVWMIHVQRVILNKRDRHQSAFREVLGDPRDCWVDSRLPVGYFGIIGGLYGWLD